MVKRMLVGFEVKVDADLSTNDNGQQWKFGEADASGYYNIINPESTYYLTAVSADNITIKGTHFFSVHI